jgi:hypothetical protein
MTDFSTKIFEDAYNKAKKEGKKYSQEANTRRVIAYSLKAIAVFGGIALATGLEKQPAQVIGILIAIVIALDAIFSNHKRLLVITTASKAYKSLFDRIEFEYNSNLAPIIKTKDQGQIAVALEKLEILNQQFSKSIYDYTTELKKGVDEADLKLLETIALDDTKKGKK